MILLREIGTVRALPVEHCPHRPTCLGYCGVASLDSPTLRGRLAVTSEGVERGLMRAELIRRGLVP